MTQEEHYKKADALIDDMMSNRMMGDDFDFREGQHDIIRNILIAYSKWKEGSSKKNTVVIEAPTGTGKSIIAMATSRCLELINQTGYIITSDLSLQDQYSADFKNRGLDYGCVKGVDNYTCSMNNEKFSLGECQLRMMPTKMRTSLPCYSTCGYYTARNKAVRSEVALLGYSFYLIQMNYVNRKIQEAIEAGEDVDEDNTFQKRDFCFFDECHKVDDIVQGHFAARIEPAFIDKLRSYNEFLKKNALSTTVLTIALSRCESAITDLDMSDDPDEWLEALKKICNVLAGFVKVSKDVKVRAKSKFPISVAIPAAWKTNGRIADRIKDMHCKIQDLIEFFQDLGVPTTDLIRIKDGNDLEFHCADVSFLLKKHFHAQAEFKVMMSATVGDIDKFAKVMGIIPEEMEHHRMNPPFDYSKSPVVLFRNCQMDFRNRDKNFPKAVGFIDKIITRHAGQKGIIHTGSHQFTEKLYSMSDHQDRLLPYKTSQEKNTALAMMDMSDDKIVIGPSLLEGLDLKDDEARFVIFLKVPFQNLGSPLIQHKLKKDNSFYSWKAAIAILQGAGRGIRNPEDWAWIYIIDSSFMNLLRDPGIIPQDFKDRFIYAKS